MLVIVAGNVVLQNGKIKKTAENNRKMPVEGLRKIAEASGVNISNRTLRRRLSEMNLKARRP